ncbi:MAG TPA: FMN-binding protein [Candidatus Saccharimonadales bacterium]|nr:FMN-binding protein [Candidatus Saccharimonadales bacterium]
MKKYLQITVLFIIFGIVVLLRQLRGSEEQNRVVGNSTMPNSSLPPGQQTNISYKDGTYTGDVTDAYYGNVQVQVAIVNGKISDVIFLQYPNDARTSQVINAQAMPLLKSEAIQAQSANVDIVSGASQTSQAFQQSLASALKKAS